MADLGEDVGEVEFSPLTAPSVPEPEVLPASTPEEVPVEAPVEEPVPA